jgi:alanine racemase
VRRLRPTVAVIDLAAVRHNVRALKPATSELMAVVKGDGYGHGAVPVARAAQEAGATWLGVALVEEGIELREAGVREPVLVLSEVPRGREEIALDAELTPTVYTDEGVDAVADASRRLGRSTAVHVKVDTGMHRVGVYPPERVRPLVERAASSGLDVQGAWTHFARAEDDESTTRAQLARFVESVELLPERPRILHAANSAATIRFPESHLDLVRPGIACYGVEPAPGIGAELSLRPALTWRSAVTMVKRLPAGEAISYGHRYTLSRSSVIATVPVGYADGYARALSSGEVLIRGRRHPVAGSVTMDQILVDCGDDEVAVGDDVVLLGTQGREAVTADDLGRIMGTIAYEVVTMIGERVPREYEHADAVTEEMRA